MESTNKGGDQFNLKWNHHTANFIQVFAEHQNQGSLVDVTLTCEGQYIKAHKLILSACSGYFQSIFQLHPNVSHPFILLNGMKFKDLRHILNFMYHGEVKVLDSDLQSVLALGDSLQVKGLLSVKLRDKKNHNVDTDKHGGLPLHCSDSTGKNQTEPPDLNILNSKKIKKTLNGSNTYKNSSSSSNEQKENVRNDNLEKEPYKQLRQVRTDGQNGLNTAEPPLKKWITPSKSSVAVDMSDVKNTNVSNSRNNEEKEAGNINTPETKEDKLKHKMHRPPSAFMIFANVWRKKLGTEHPDENNKEISVRLGNMWKVLSPKTKSAYYYEARELQKEHEKQNSCYNYIPQETGLDENKLRNYKRSKQDQQINVTVDVDPMLVVDINEEPVNITESD